MSYAAVSFDPAHQLAAVHRLWERCFDSRWTLTAHDFEAVAMAGYASGDHVVVVEEGRLIGFGATQTRTVPGEAEPRAELMTIVVDPDYRRRGIGRVLLGACLVRLLGKGATTVQLGGGGQSYFWPGVPESLGGAWAFFEAAGWTEEELSFDLLGRLDDCVIPPVVADRLASTGVSVALAAPEDLPGMKVLVESHFPAWAESYVDRIGTPSAEDIVIARSPEGEVIGMSCAEMPPDCCRWSKLKADTGSVGALGVRPDWREKGVGLAIAAKVTETLKERGVRNCFVGWTWLVDWYGQLGYEVWETYRMSRKTIAPER